MLQVILILKICVKESIEILSNSYVYSKVNELQSRMNKEDFKVANYYLDVNLIYVLIIQEANWDVDLAYKEYKADLDFEKNADQNKMNLEMSRKMKYKSTILFNILD